MKEFWVDVLKFAVPVAIAALAYGIAALVRRVRAKKGASEAEQEAVEAACVAAKKLLDQTLFGAVTAAEKAWGSGTGAAKLDEVRERVLLTLPEELRTLVPADWLQRVIDAALDEAKRKWAQNPALLAEEPIIVTAAQDIASGQKVELTTAVSPLETTK